MDMVMMGVVTLVMLPLAASAGVTKSLAKNMSTVIEGGSN